MRSVLSENVEDAVILAAGNGDRFKSPPDRSKLLHSVLGKPLILRTLETAAAAGIRRFHVVLGFDAARVQRTIERHRPLNTSVEFLHNPDWHLENGVSALRARATCSDRRFALLMGDHLFDPSVLRRLASHATPDGTSLLAVDTATSDPAVVAEATRVRLDGPLIVDIGKDLTVWDGLDTGVFIFTPALFDALDAARRDGETTLSAGVRRLAQQRLMVGATISDSRWHDVDTIDDLHAAEFSLATVTGVR